MGIVIKRLIVFALCEMDSCGPWEEVALFADMLKQFVSPGDPCVPVRERDVCANCKQEVQKGDKLKKCVRCHAVSYCGEECQRHHWRVHKLSCTSKEQRIDQVLDGLEGDPGIGGLMRTCSRALAFAALEATGQHVAAARFLCSVLAMGGLNESH